MSILVSYQIKGTEPVMLSLEGDPFDICAAIEQRMFPQLKEDGWERLLEWRKKNTLEKKK